MHLPAAVRLVAAAKATTAIRSGPRDGNRRVPRYGAGPCSAMISSSKFGSVWSGAESGDPALALFLAAAANPLESSLF